MGTKVFDNALDLITFSRASGGTSLRKISYGSELFDSNVANWSRGFFSVDGTLTYDSGSNTLTHTLGASDTSSARWTIPITCEVGDILLLSGDIVFSGTGGAVGLTPNSNGTGFIASNAISGVADEVIVVATSSPMYLVITTNGVVGDTTSATNISVKEVLFDQPDGTLTLFNHPDNIPRIDYNPDGTVKGLLIEEQRVNYIAISSGWNTSGTNISFGGYTTAPDGTNTASLFVTDATGNYNRGVGGITTSSTYTDIVYSVFVKKELARYATFKVNISSIDGRFWYDFDTGTTGFSTHPTYINRSISAEDYPDGWKRITITLSNSNYTGYFGLGLASSNDQPYSTYNRNITGDGTQGAYFWGAQAEFGSFATSYISTSGSPATRSADIASIPVTDFGYNNRKQTLLLTAISAAPDNNLGTGVNTNTLAQLDSSSGTNYSSLGIGSTSTRVNRPSLVSRNNTAVPVAAGDLVSLENTFDEGNVVKFAGAFDPVAGTIAGSVNGSAVFSATGDVGGLGLPFTQLFFGKGQGAAYIKSIQYYPRRLTNTQLQELTS